MSKDGSLPGNHCPRLQADRVQQNSWLWFVLILNVSVAQQGTQIEPCTAWPGAISTCQKWRARRVSDRSNSSQRPERRPAFTRSAAQVPQSATVRLRPSKGFEVKFLAWSSQPSHVPDLEGPNAKQQYITSVRESFSSTFIRHESPMGHWGQTFESSNSKPSSRRMSDAMHAKSAALPDSQSCSPIA